MSLRGEGEGQKPQLFTPWSPSISIVHITGGLLTTVPITLHSTHSSQLSQTLITRDKTGNNSSHWSDSATPAPQVHSIVTRLKRSSIASRDYSLLRMRRHHMLPQHSFLSQKENSLRAHVFATLVTSVETRRPNAEDFMKLGLL
jgi:hypothetical protein